MSKNLSSIGVEFGVRVSVIKLVEGHGEEHRHRIEIGVSQVANLWRKEDGNAEDLISFCEEQFVSDPEELTALFNRFQDNFEQLNGHLHEMRRFWGAPMQVVTHSLLPVDPLFAQYSPYAHLSEDLFKSKIAFVALLNFSLFRLEEMLEQGQDWSRRQWAEARLVADFKDRIPAHVGQEIAKVHSQADTYVNQLNFHMDRVVVDGECLFPKDLKLISHWGLRDQLKGLYTDQWGLRAQETIYRIMQRVIEQSVPASVIDNHNVEWRPFEGFGVKDVKNSTDWIDDSAEPHTRYEHLLAAFKAVKSADEHYTDKPTYIDRSFNDEREVSEAHFEGLMDDILSSPVAKQVGEFVAKRLGRPLQPFDIWYNLFVPKQDATKLDEVVKKKYPTVQCLQQEIPEILLKLGFNWEIGICAATKIVIEPGRSAGHITGADRREDRHYIRVRMPEDLVPNYQAFNTLMHELGHGIEMYFSIHTVDHNILRHVPNTAFTEAFAFIFQAKTIDILGAQSQDETIEHLSLLEMFWHTYEIAGVGLVDMKIWNWMYKNPDVTAKELCQAVQRIAKSVWNQYFAPVFGVRDQTILAIYSHIIDCFLYTPDYFLGSLIQHQIQTYIEDKSLPNEVKRMTQLGNLAPDIWMQQAVGESISAKPLIKATEQALKELE